jgi:periplasmic divalent cation tolerance protein
MTQQPTASLAGLLRPVTGALRCEICLPRRESQAHTSVMRPTAQFAVALVTTPDLKTARRLARAALAARLAACVNLVPKVESHYWWRSKIERGTEVLLLLKTTAARVGALEKLILAQHPYDTPEFIVLRLDGGNRRYLDWWSEAVA